MSKEDNIHEINFFATLLVFQRIRITNPDFLHLTSKELSEEFESGHFLTTLCFEEGKQPQIITYGKDNFKPIIVGEIISTQVDDDEYSEFQPTENEDDDRKPFGERLISSLEGGLQKINNEER